MAGSLYHKGGCKRLVAIRRHNPTLEVDVREFAEAVDAMPPLPGVGSDPAPSGVAKPGIDDVLITPVRESGQDDWTRFQGASAAIGHYVRMAHDGRISRDEAWEAICQYNAAMLRPSWPLERLASEAQRLWRLHQERNGPALQLASPAAPASLPTFTLGELLDDTGPMPDDLIAPRLLTPGGMLVLGGAPKVGKSDFVISLLAHMAAGVPFLGFARRGRSRSSTCRRRCTPLSARAHPGDPPRRGGHRRSKGAPGRHAEGADAARRRRVAATTAAIRDRFADAPPDIIVIDPIRNLFDGGAEGKGENDNAAMLFFLQERVEALRDAVSAEGRADPLPPHPQDHQEAAPRGSVPGAVRRRQPARLLYRRHPDAPAGRGPAGADAVLRAPQRPGDRAELVDKVNGRWIEIDRGGERLVRKAQGERFDAERVRKHDVILQILFEEARQGRVYTASQFAEAFENKAGLGGNTVIRERLSVLATKGFIKFFRDEEYGLPPPGRSRFGYLCVEGMELGAAGHSVDPDTGEVTESAPLPVLPTHYKCPQTGVALAVGSRG